MNLAKLFEMQKVLDEHIMDEHPELKGQDNLDWKILALQVELGECANEWRGFKKWSKDQEPRNYEKCHVCKGIGETMVPAFPTFDENYNLSSCCRKLSKRTARPFARLNIKQISRFRTWMEQPKLLT